LIDLKRRNLKAQKEFPIVVRYNNKPVGECYADLVVDDLMIVEIKAAKTLLPEHEAQLLNYLKATPYEVGLLLNFGPKPEQKRRSFDNNRKEWWQAWHPSFLQRSSASDK
jgi:GxxExxY protein